MSLIYNLKLGECAVIRQPDQSIETTFVRVPGGWRVTTNESSDPGVPTAIFVPYNEEFMSTDAIYQDTTKYDERGFPIEDNTDPEPSALDIVSSHLSTAAQRLADISAEISSAAAMLARLADKRINTWV